MIFRPSQEFVINEGCKWWKSDNQVFQYSGSPGTGKTTVLLEMLKRFGVSMNRVAPMAFVGAAAINMRMHGLTAARTIHSWLYEIHEVPVRDNKGKIVMDPYFNIPKMKYVMKPRDLHDIDLFVIDEGGTVPYHMLDDILSRGKKIIVSGDLDQLDPVGDRPAFLASGNVYMLTEIMRQSAGSAIVWLCQRAIKGLPIHCGLYGDVLVIQESDLTDQMLANAGVSLLLWEVH